ncbi:hypothetical protein PVK06_004537 [Gossypium arboreum]|uniref:Retrotransposon Copia-like N-terminal domain-containing protein n=1 Tax=Gossypium arboreum TaxID=29729 RepID=A0ABR0QTJ6_GOSAR|nr:hypothetical protein PVK06_004537 [Gossypium arboreum]
MGVGIIIEMAYKCFPSLISKMEPTPLLNILTENKLNRNNYKEWKRNLMIFFSCEKLKTVLNNKCPLATQTEARKH